MRQANTDTQGTKRALTSLIEQYARTHGLTFLQAGRIVCADPTYRDLVMEGMGGWYRGKPPSDSTINRLKDLEKKRLAKLWPKVTKEDFSQEDLELYLSPYLKKPARKAAKPPRYKSLRAEAANLFESGMSQPEIARKLGVGRSTVYRWLPINRA